MPTRLTPGEMEIVVVGGGPAGLSATLTAARLGARVLLLDGYALPGGQYYHQPPEWRAAHATRRQQEGRELWQSVLAAGVEIRSETIVWDIAVSRTGEKSLSVAGPGGGDTIRTRQVILATGTYERPAVFPGWTLPGVITAGAAQTMLYHNARPGQRVLLAGTGPLQLLVAQHLLHAGVTVAGILEGTRPGAKLLGQAGALWGQWQRIREGIAALAVIAQKRAPFRPGWGIRAVHGTGKVEGATIARLDRSWQPILGTEQFVQCDTVCTGYGFIPFNPLAKLAGADFDWHPELGGEIPRRSKNMETTVQGLYAIGDGAGVGGYRLAMLEGQAAGMDAAAQAGRPQYIERSGKTRLEKALRRERAFQHLYAGLFTPGEGIYQLARPETLVCRCEEVTQERLERAIQNGAATMPEVKALTRCGMGPCQGRMCGQQVLQTIARMTGKRPEEIGSNTVRPPVFPILIGDLVGK